MKRKKINKLEREFISDLLRRQNHALMSLSSLLEKMSKNVSQIQSKIQSHGCSANYSASSDILKIAEDIYRQELTLSQLKTIQTDIEYGSGLKKK